MKNLLNKRGKIPMVIPFLLAFLLAGGMFLYMSFNTETVYMVDGKVLEAGTQITEALLTDGTLVMKEANKDLISKPVITSLDSIKGKYVSQDIYPGRQLTAHDFIENNNVVNDKTLRENNLEAVDLSVIELTSFNEELEKGQKVNVYSSYEYDLDGYRDQETNELLVDNLDLKLKKLFLDNGYSEESNIKADTVIVTKLILQNVPVIKALRNDENELMKVSLGTDSESAEIIYHSLKTGEVSLSLIPNTDNDYVPKETKGTVTLLELVGEKTIQSEE
ncbi:MAG: hypothetical protein ACOCP4_01115 [Candidatus Woesearchaeota archaeon]